MANEQVQPTAPAETPAQTNEQIVGEPKPSAATAPVVTKHKIKWGETEKEVTTEEAVQLAQKAWGIEEKAKSYSEKIKAAETLLDMLQKDPKAFAKQAKKAGLDPEKLATEILYDRIRRNQMTPEQQELEELKEKEAERLALEKEQEELRKAQEVDAKTREWSMQFEQQLEAALKAQKLPKTRLALALTAQYIDAGLKEKKNYTVEQVLPYVMRDLQQVHKETIGKLDGDDLLAYLGDDLAEKISKARVAKYKLGAPAATVPQQKKEADYKGPLPKEITKLKGKAYFAALRKWKSEQGIGAYFE